MDPESLWIVVSIPGRNGEPAQHGVIAKDRSGTPRQQKGLTDQTFPSAGAAQKAIDKAEGKRA